MRRITRKEISRLQTIIKECGVKQLLITIDEIKANKAKHYTYCVRCGKYRPTNYFKGPRTGRKYSYCINCRDRINKEQRKYEQRLKTLEE